MQDLTVVLYTANYISDRFFANTQKYLLDIIGQFNLPLVVVSQKPMNFENNIVMNIGRSHLNIYRQALAGAKAAKTKYIALVEDDVLYHPSHFVQRPTEGRFAYNMNVWAIFTWGKPPIFNYKGRINLSGLICERELFIEAMEERFAKYPSDSMISLGKWAEPGKYEKLLRVTERELEQFSSDFPNVAFSHETALAFLNLGTRKKMGQPRALEIPYWGKAEEVMKLNE